VLCFIQNHSFLSCTRESSRLCSPLSHPLTAPLPLARCSRSHEYAESVRPIHKPPKKISEHLAYWAIQATRMTFDFATGYRHDKPQTELQWLR
jgi:hypothetical protein